MRRRWKGSLAVEMGPRRCSELKVLIRDEQESDRNAIAEVTRAAFENHPYSQGTEQFIVDALRASQALTISLVADVNGEVVGHIAFSPVTISDGSRNWYGLGPISVLPKWQKQGIGKSLVLEGLARLHSLGAGGCMLVGDPNYYGRFGFKTYPDLIHPGVPLENFLALPFGTKKAQGIVTFDRGFSAKS
jgi:putative acetyltransferase